MSDELVIKCNNGPRPLVSFSELPVQAGVDFEYVPDEEKLTPRFVLYRGSWYDTKDTEGQPSSDYFRSLGFDAFISDSFFSGVLFKFFDREGKLLEDEVIVGRYYS